MNALTNRAERQRNKTAGPGRRLPARPASEPPCPRGYMHARDDDEPLAPVGHVGWRRAHAHRAARAVGRHSRCTTGNLVLSARPGQ